MRLISVLLAFSWCLVVDVRAALTSIVFSNPLKPANPSKPFEFPFQRMVVERRYTGRVYVAGVNRLYQLRADLQLEYKYDTGPVDDSPECPSNSVCEMVKLQPTNNYNKALAIYLKTNKLIACGSVRQGLCRLHNVYNITAADPQVPEPVVANDKDSSSVIFVAPGPPEPSTTDTLYVASTFTDFGEYRDEVPAVATLSLQNDNLFKVAHRTINSQTQIFVERSKRKSYKIDYVYGFSSGNFSYFLTRQQTASTASSPYQSKLVRLCQRDRHYYSYTEVPLVCRGDDGVDYNLAQSAYVSKAGFDLARNLSISVEDDVLFVVFSKGDVEPLRNHLTSASAMCAFSMRFVEAKFAENIKNCASGTTMRGLDFFKKEIMCYKTVHSLDTSCGSEVNYPLGGTVPILQKPAYVTNGARLTSVVATTTHMYTVVFMGTEDGQLKKVVVETAAEAEEYGSIDLDVDRAPIIDLQLDTSGEFLFVLTANSLSKIKPYECEQHNRCATCLSAKDPYCGWCSSQTKCIARMSCEHSAWLAYKDAQCTTITKVTPDKIPITQAQFLKLEIQNLPTFTSQGQLSCVFTLAGRKLTTGATKSLDVANVVTCTTPQTSLLPPIPAGSDSLAATLSVQIDNGVDFSATNFTFYDCTSYKSCSECAKSSFLCDWCVETAICAHNAEDKCRGMHLINSLSRQGPSNRKGPSFCPAILAVDEADIYVTSGSSKDVTVKTINLMDFQTDFTCRFEFGGKTYDKDATKIENEMIKCESVDFVYSDSSANATAKFSVLWSDGRLARPLDNPQNIRVIMYKCDRLATNCGLCLYLNSKFECGWCDGKSSCTTNAVCDGGAVWLNRSSWCPWPQISNFYPKTGPIEGGTRLTIEGVNLGRSYSDIKDKIRVKNKNCAPIESLYEVSTRIVCETSESDSKKPHPGDVVVQLREGQQYIALSQAQFQYVDPVINGFEPKSGPQSGGTVVTIEGDFLNAGSNISASIGGIPCAVVETSRYKTKCRASAATTNKMGHVSIKFDNAVRDYNEQQFSYEQDPQITSLSRYRTIVSGGLNVDVRGARFNLIQDAKMYLLFDGKRFYSTCDVLSSEFMRCSTPKLTSVNVFPDSSDHKVVNYGFDFDGVDAFANNSSSISREPFFVYRDPMLETFPENPAFDNRRVKVVNSAPIEVNGKYLDAVLKNEDVKLVIGSEVFNVSNWPMFVALKAPEKEPQVPQGYRGLPEVVVVVGDGNLNFSMGYLSYDIGSSLSSGTPVTIIATVVALVAFVIAVVIIGVMFRRKSSRQQDQMKRLKDQIDAIELKVASECKEAFAELQTDMTELTADMAVGIPFLTYRDYAMQVLFPGHVNHPVVRELDVEPQKRAQVEKGLQQFNQLLMNKTFLVLFIRTLESNRYFLSQSRVTVGSLLMVILQEKMEYCTDVLKSLLADLIERTIERRYQPKILFRRSESVAERMLGVWYTFLLYRYIVDCAGQPLFMLYWAIKQQVEKGPHDAVTYEARYSLSEEKLIRQTIDFHALTVYVCNFDSSTETPVRVFDCDTITQVKEKCLDAVYKTTPYSRRPSASEIDLEWRTGVSGRLVLQDLDVTTKTEQGGWRRLNTLAHYKVPTNASLALVPKQASMYNLSLLSDRSDKSSTFSLKNSPTLTRTFGGGAGNASTIGTNKENDATYKTYHLIKPTDQQDLNPDRGGGKMMSEIYLTRLLTAKGTLQKFVEDLFETIFSTAYRGTTLPVCVKYMFDFMDDQALLHDIADPEVVHTWKSNSLPLRFWVNLIKNPHFVFDIARPVKIEGCLSVVAQTLMDSCSTQDPQLTKDSPSSKLLFARDIHTYREWVDRYYHDVRHISAISDQDMNAYLADESRQHFGEFNVTSALYELYKFLEQYGENLATTLEEDETATRMRLPTKFAQMIRTMNGVGAPPEEIPQVVYGGRATSTLRNQPPPSYDTLLSNR